MQDENNEKEKKELWTNPVLITIANILMIILTWWMHGGSVFARTYFYHYIPGIIFAVIIYKVYSNKPNITLRNIWFVYRFV